MPRSAAAAVEGTAREAEPGRRRARRAARVSDDVIHREIYDAITDHRLPPGTPLPEDTVAAAFGVSRTVVRKALIRLAHDRLVDLRPNRGAAVARPSGEEARQLFEARRMIEPALIVAAVAAIGDGAIEELRARVGEEREAYARGDRRTMIRLSGDFHRRLAEIAGNRVLSEFLGELISRTSLVIALYERPGIWPCSLDEHARLLAAIARRDGAGAAELMRDHLDHCERQLDLTGEGRTVDLLALFGDARAAPGPRRRAAP